jgi:hypothetical protein
MSSLIIGSTAMWNVGLTHREPKDIDVFTKYPDDFSETIDGYWHESFGDWLGDSRGIRSATPDELYTIKVSHAYWELKNGSWGKHMSDILRLKDHGATLDLGLHKLLYTVWEERYGSKQMDLSKEADSFFADAVKRKYDHDSIHYSVAYGDVPMYVQILKDGHTVDVDPKKLWAMSHGDLVKLFREEIMATALERIVIPRNYETSPGAAYLWALRRTITSLTKGRSARFIVTNYHDFYKPDTDYVQRHLANKHKLILLGG